MRRERRRGFTLVELLVVIGILAVLMGVLLPALAKARQAGITIKCCANLHSIGQAIAGYVADNKGAFPASYMYVGQTIGSVNTASSANGYIHWSSLVFPKAGNLDPNAPNSAYRSLKGWDMFQCPALENGGLQPTHTWTGNYDDSTYHQPDDPNLVDQQAPRMSYTANEAVMPRNKFKLGDGSGDDLVLREERFVKFSQIKKPNRVVLVTEFLDDGKVISEFNGESGTNNQPIKSHRPVHGWTYDGLSSNPKLLNVNLLGPSGGGFGRSAMQLRLAKPGDLHTPYPLTVDTMPTTKTRLDWVGRNHGSGKTAKTNFLYCDGHVETKLIEDTLAPVFEWGAEFYSLANNGDLERSDD